MNRHGHWVRCESTSRKYEGEEHTNASNAHIIKMMTCLKGLLVERNVRQRVGTWPKLSTVVIARREL